MEVFDWAQAVEEWVSGPCLHCDDDSSSPTGSEHVAMPVARPQYVDGYLDDLAGPNEQHTADPDSHCVNPKCNYRFTPQDFDQIERSGGEFVCPQCHFEYDYMASEKSGELYQHDPETNKAVLNPGGITRSGLTLEQMGSIGEQVVARMGELPGVGVIEPASLTYNFPIDCIVQAQRGNFGCEIKTNHSQAQERFKVGGKEERQKKIQHCLTNGLKPALIGVRLNFYTDKAYVFFREGLTDTWVGNSKMMHVGTVDFSDLNPFKSPDAQAQAMAVENAQLPDQSLEEEFDAIFGQLPAKSAGEFETEHPRDDKGKFTFKDDVHELKVVDKKGKHTHNARRCKHCGHLNYVPSSHRKRVDCSTCGHDPDRVLTVAKIVLTSMDADSVAKQLGFQFIGRTGQGHRKYAYTDQVGNNHPVVIGSGAHGKRAAEIDAQRARQRMSRCLKGECMHGSSDVVEPVADPGQPVARAGQTVILSGKEHFVMEANGGLALVYDPDTGKQDIVPTEQLRTAAESDPNYLYVYYMSELHVEPYHVNLRHEEMLEQLLDKFGVDLGNGLMDIDPSQSDAGEIRTTGGEVEIEHKQLSPPEVREYAEEAIRDWWRKQQNEDWVEESAWESVS